MDQAEQQEQEEQEEDVAMAAEIILVAAGVERLMAADRPVTNGNGGDLAALRNRPVVNYFAGHPVHDMKGRGKAGGRGSTVAAAIRRVVLAGGSGGIATSEQVAAAAAAVVSHLNTSSGSGGGGK